MGSGVVVGGALFFYYFFFFWSGTLDVLGDCALWNWKASVLSFPLYSV